MAPGMMSFLSAPTLRHSPGDGLGFLFGVVDAKQAGEYLRVSPEAVVAEAEAGRLPGQKIENEWRFVLLAVAQWLLAGPSSTAKANKEALLAVAGCLAGDDTLPQIVAEAYRRRASDVIGGRK